MFTLVIGGAASGKSEYAERLILRSPARPRLYIAAMQPLDAESRARVARHRALRAGKQFLTVERYTDLAGAVLPAGGAVLLECLSNLTANELYDPAGAGEDTVGAVLRGVEAVRAQCRDLVAVSSEVFCGGSAYAGDTARYLRVLAEINRRLAARADNVAEVVCGQAIYYKGKEPQP